MNDKSQPCFYRKTIIGRIQRVKDSLSQRQDYEREPEIIADAILRLLSESGFGRDCQQNWS